MFKKYNYFYYSNHFPLAFLLNIRFQHHFWKQITLAFSYTVNDFDGNSDRNGRILEIIIVS